MENKLLNFKSIKIGDMDKDYLSRINDISKRDVAVIGVSGRFGCTNSVDEFWEALKTGKDLIGEFGGLRKEDSDAYLKFWMQTGLLAMNPQYNVGAFLEEIDKFDCGFFNISPKEANGMDPNQRIFLETAWEAIEDAGYGGQRIKGSRTGVYVGFSNDSGDEYKRYIQMLAPNQTALNDPGNIKSIIGSRIAYLLDLKGPSMMIDTACSSSLIAVHLACQGIRNGDCDMAIAGGIKVFITPLKTIHENDRIGIESSDGRAKTFDDSSDGTGVGEGVGAVLLKPLNKAVEDGDHIYAVVKGTAINQDGASVGLTAPNAAAQEDVILRAWKDSGIDPQTISYIEAHGTGTKLGDPIEIKGIEKAFKCYTDKRQFCAITSVKTNIGHLDNAAGIAGFIKAVMALKHAQLPPSLHFAKPNRKISFEDSSVYINDRLVQWDTKPFPKRCGISSFGLSGTNCHVVLEEAPEIKNDTWSIENKIYVLLISAKSETSLKESIRRYAELLKSGKSPELAELCYTANTGRGHYSYRLAVITKDKLELQEKLYKLSDMHSGSNDEGVYYGIHKLVSSRREVKEAYEYTDEEIKELSILAENMVETFLKSGKTSMGALEKVCSLYVKGAEINWQDFYRDEKRKKVRLPVYPFERTRCWIDLPKSENLMLPHHFQNLYYSAVWRKRKPQQAKNEAKEGSTIVLKGVGEKIEEIVKRLRQCRKDIIEVKLGEGFQSLNDGNFIIDGSLESFKRLLSKLKDRNISQVIHLCTAQGSVEIKDVIEIDESQKKGVYNLLYLSQAISSREIKEPIDLVVISEKVYEITGMEQMIYPQNATLFGLGKVVRLENPMLKCRCIDIDRETGIDTILIEINYPSDEYLTAYRNGDRYTQEIGHADLSRLDDDEIEVKNDGVYIITGGTGRLGLKIAQWLASQNKVNIALLNRTHFPDRNVWERIIVEGKDPELCQRIEAIQKIESTGTAITLCSTDVTEITELNSTLSKLRECYGKINGIIHCAGIGVGSKGILLKDEQRETFENILAPKVYGTWLLENLTKDDNPDFLILFSSAITITGGVGAGSYTTANTYLDSFVLKAKKYFKKVLSINWTTWESVLRFAGVKIDKDRLIFKIIPDDTALKAFDIVVHKKINNVIIGEMNIGSSIFDIKPYMPFTLSQDTQSEIKQNRTQIKLDSFSDALPEVTLTGKAENESYTEMEDRIARVWGKVLGIGEINIYDSFFDLGGHSVLAVKLEVEMGKAGMPVEGADIYKYQTIKDMASYLGTKEACPNVQKCILDNIEPFNELYYKSCFYNALFPVVRHFNKSLIPVLINDMILYCMNRDKENPDIEYRAVKNVESVLDEQGITVVKKHQSLDVIGDICKSVSGGRPVILWVDCFYASIRPDTYEKVHWAHTWLVYGYDDNKREFHILEHKHRDSLTYEKRAISFQGVVDSYNGFINFFQPDKNTSTYYEFYPDSTSSEDDLGIYLRIFKKNMLDYKKTIAEGLQEFASFIDFFKLTVADREILAKYSIEDCIQGINNIINAKLVERFRAERLISDNSGILEILDKIINYWNSVRSVLAKVLYSNTYKDDDFDYICDQLELILRDELNLQKILVTSISY
ncbi:beta-ketoacyl synthase N-terminal-like domain-containing protein [Pseudobacteroides cellulosolvens]|uniref:6-deoxyerythronolide-B synthase, Phenylalanine racemase (ATP-hydrolyzing) n=1 Tax=Pseudobacteroides cellulosolvens ATCC 35603 = DSM 2933 TaxID=398512 RepID=A0A0L6JGW4_9FIRM|nr:beta-ketoacyl synthase N-terminal-like domain-containing protein [Pseudobacteroides cellulosolvens]KNY24968.1 6-deoxyerythronolide-B synthase, Phenylalanine racemase (ATP-hydrolyzing) [Pseudobacteroides cellulosolvens ATCC 35603 = DSM 2933]